MIASMISRIIGLLYRRPLGNILGSVGLGYYGYASNLYSILLLISSYSIPMAVSKIVSERLALKRYRNAHRAFLAALIYAAVVGGIAALIAWFGGAYLLPKNQLNALPALRVLSPTIFLSAILGVLRGYFQANQNMTPTSVSQIAEQIMNAIVSILAAWILVARVASDGGNSTAIYGAVGGTMGTGAGVLTGLIFMLFVYGVNRKIIFKRIARDKSETEESYSHIFQVIFLMVTPIIFTTFINNASTYLDSYLYSTIQDWHGFDADAISAAYGEFSNYYIPIINIPLAIASASASALMPEVSGQYALGNHENANEQINTTIRLTMFICIPAMVGLTILAGPIMQLLFPSASELAARILMFGSLYVLFTALATITGSVLQSIGQQRTALFNAGISLILNLVCLALLLFLIPRLDIYAVMIANILFSVVYCLMNALSLRRYLGFRNEMKKTYGEPLLASLLMAAVTLPVYSLIFRVSGMVLAALPIAILAAVLVYLIGYVKISRISEEELRKFPLGTKLVKVLRKIRIYR